MVRARIHTRIARCARLDAKSDSVKHNNLKKADFLGCESVCDVVNNTHTAAVRCITRKVTTMTKNAEKTFAEICKSVTAKRVDAMVESIEASFARRDEFEGATADNSGSSYCVNRNKVLEHKHTVARFFCALGIKNAGDVIERKVNSNKMFNAKALKKIVELARFSQGGLKVTSVESVITAFIICTSALSRKNDGAALVNANNKAFLSSGDLSSFIEDEKLREAIEKQRHATISGGKDTQSSQARNVCDVLKIGSIVNEDSRYRGAFKIDHEHALVRMVESASTK